VIYIVGNTAITIRNTVKRPEISLKTKYDKKRAMIEYTKPTRNISQGFFFRTKGLKIYSRTIGLILKYKIYKDSYGI